MTFLECKECHKNSLATSLNKHVKSPFVFCASCAKEMEKLYKKETDPVFRTVQCGITFSVFALEDRFQIQAGNTLFTGLFDDLKSCKEAIQRFADRPLFYG